MTRRHLMKRLLVIGLAIPFALLLAACGPQAVYLVAPPTTTTAPTTTTTTARPLEITPTVTCPAHYEYEPALGSECTRAEGAGPVPHYAASITCPRGYTLADDQATGYYQECLLS